VQLPWHRFYVFLASSVNTVGVASTQLLTDNAANASLSTCTTNSFLYSPDNAVNYVCGGALTEDVASVCLKRPRNSEKEEWSAERQLLRQ